MERNDLEYEVKSIINIDELDDDLKHSLIENYHLDPNVCNIVIITTDERIILLGNAKLKSSNS